LIIGIKMNERITLLAFQASDPKTGWLDRQKFAKLIVQECAAQVDWILAEGGKTQGDMLKEHFGVKE
jgi:hypothetical protein